MPPVRFIEKLLRAKATMYVLIVGLGLWPIVAYIQNQPSLLADPEKYLLHRMGFVASLLLAITLTLTPLRVLWPKWDVALALNRHRRLLGVSAFVYACLHLALHINYEGGFITFAKDIEKPFLLTGMVAFTILLILSITSLHWMVRKLGGKRWKNLHRLVYLAAALVIYHQSAARKIFPVQVLWIFVPLGLLEIARIIRQLKTKQEVSEGFSRKPGTQD